MLTKLKDLILKVNQRKSSKKTKNLVRIVLIIGTHFFTVNLPIYGLIEFSLIDFASCPSCEFNLGDFQLRLEITTFLTVGIGIIATFIRYTCVNYRKYSQIRTALNLLYSSLLVLITAFYWLLSPIYIVSSNSKVSFDITGIFVLLAIIGSLFIIKSLYDFIDLKIHQEYYSRLQTINRNNYSALWAKNLMECPKCKYMCQITWKSCPIAILGSKKSFNFDSKESLLFFLDFHLHN